MNFTYINIYSIIIIERNKIIENQIEKARANKTQGGHTCQEPDEAGTGSSSTRKGTELRERASRGRAGKAPEKLKIWWDCVPKIFLGRKLSPAGTEPEMF